MSERIVGPCVLCNHYFHFDVRTHPPKYCGECAKEAKRMNTRDRQRRYRDRQREAAKEELKTAKSHRASGSLPVGGLYHDQPEPIRTQLRARVGLR